MLQKELDRAFRQVGRELSGYRPELRVEEVGSVLRVGDGVARVRGLPGVRSEELLELAGGVAGLAFNLDPEEVGVVLLGDSPELAAGSEVRRTGRVVDVPVGEALLGRVVDGSGRPLDDRGRLRTAERRPVEREAPPILDRAPVATPLQTGLKVVDALVPIGRGQRELLVGDRQTGKTSIAVDAILNQRGTGVVCVYCAVGQRGTAVARVVADLRERGALEHTVVVVAAGEDPPGLQYLTPYAATAMAEYFVDQGRDALIVYDDLTRHARAYRELSLLLRRPPGREAYPGDIFYIHSRLLERAARLRPERGGGSLTALPIVEIQAQNIAAYIPTNLISITDGQIYLSPSLFHKGVMPAVDAGKSVSRVGGKAQLPAYHAVAGSLRLAYSQFEELETFSRFGTRLDEATRRAIERGRRVREVLKQREREPLPVSLQVAVMVAVDAGLFDPLPVDRVVAAEERVRRAVAGELPELCAAIEAGEELEQVARQRIVETAAAALAEEEPA